MNDKRLMPIVAEDEGTIIQVLRSNPPMAVVVLPGGRYSAYVLNLANGEARHIHKKPELLQ